MLLGSYLSCVYKPVLDLADIQTRLSREVDLYIFVGKGITSVGVKPLFQNQDLGLFEVGHPHIPSIVCMRHLQGTSEFIFPSSISSFDFGCVL
jgi:hypothetical protein